MKALAATLGLLFLADAAPAWSLSKFADWARVPATGRVITTAKVAVLDERGNAAAIYRDADAAIRAHNPLSANSAGYFEFFAAAGAYDLRVYDENAAEVYRISPLLLVDPTGPQSIASALAHPALTTEQPAPDTPLYPQQSTVAMRFERRTPAGTIVEVPWLISAYRAEQGLGVFSNTYGRYGRAPEVPTFPSAEPMGSNTADAGNFNIAGFNIDWHGGGILTTGEGGAWLSRDAGATVNVELGIEGTRPAPRNVVALSSTKPSSIVLTPEPAARAPFVVTAVENDRALIAVSGLATVLVKGRVRVGDALTTSKKRGYAKRAAAGTPATSILGSALTRASRRTRQATVRVRLGMVDVP